MRHVPTFVLIFFLLFSCSEYLYVKYTPVLRNPTTSEYINMPFTEDPTVLTEEHKKKMVMILERYSKKYKITNGDIYITKALSDDRDLLANYTSKALALE